MVAGLAYTGGIREKVSCIASINAVKLHPCMQAFRILTSHEHCMLRMSVDGPRSSSPSGGDTQRGIFR